MTPGSIPCSVEGGELFERIIDDDYHLTEVDCMVFVRQICEGIRFMHHMGVLHLDLKVLGVTVAGPRGTAGHWLAVGGVPVGQHCSGVGQLQDPRAVGSV